MTTPALTGLGALRSGVQLAARSLETRCAQFVLPTGAVSIRFYSSDHRRPTATHSRSRATLPTQHHAPTIVRLPAQPGPFLQWRGLKLFGGNKVITRYVDLPPDYDDATGLPFAREDLTAEQVAEIFGPHITAEAANQLLRILHGRRVAGTLEDPTLRKNTAHYSARHYKLALDYLRKTVHVDEVINAGLRAEDELAEIERQREQEQLEKATAEAVAKLKKEAASVAAKVADGKEVADEALPPVTVEIPKPKKSPYGESVVDSLVRHKEAAAQVLKARDEVEKKKREHEERHGKAGPLQAYDEAARNHPVAIWVEKWRDRATSPLEAPPEMPAWKRIGPSALFAALVTSAALAYAMNYRPKKRDERWLPDVPPAAATVGALILANVLVWIAWHIPPCWPILNRHFLLDVAVPRAHGVLTSMFSHQVLVKHLLPNMVGLWVFGVGLHDDVGRGNFLATYFSSGVLAMLGTLCYGVASNTLTLTSLGASGAMYGLCGAYLWIHRLDHFKILGFPPGDSEGISGLVLLAVAGGLNIGYAMTPMRFKVDVTSHFVGMLVGVLAGHWMEKKREERGMIPVWKVRREKGLRKEEEQS
mgnify:CR=1 FL=1